MRYPPSQVEGCELALVERMRTPPNSTVPEEATRASRALAAAWDEGALLTLDVLFAIAATILRHPSPRFLSFGSGRDSPLLCTAAIMAGGSAVFVEAHPGYAEMAREALSKVGPQCTVIDFKPSTVRRAGLRCRRHGRRDRQRHHPTVTSATTTTTTITKKK